MSESTHQVDHDEPEAKRREDRPREADEGGGEQEKREISEDTKSDGKSGGEEKESKGFRPSRKAIVIGVIVLAVIIVGGFLYWLHARSFVTTDDAYTAGHVHQISSRIAGTVASVKVEDNQPVRAGDVIVTLDPRDNEVALQKARAALQQAQAQATQAEAKIAQTAAQRSATQAQVSQAQAQVSQTSAQLERARSDYERIAGLYTKDVKAVSKADVDAATEAFNRARGAVEGSRANLAAAQAQVEAAAANVRGAEADAQVAQSNVEVSAAEVRDAELQLSYCNIPAPVNGKVSKKTVEEGQRVQPGQALLALVPENIWVVANLKETQLERLRIGQRVELKIDTLRSRIFYGRIDSIQEGSGATFSLLPPDNATGNFTKIVQRVPVKIVFDEESIRDFHDKIVPGLSVEPRIDLESLVDDRREPKRQEREAKQNRAAEAGQ